ncbi:MAG: fatty acid desaturase [Acidimicrobiales bacterium]|nr:fatty acid desaturase [Acidimicrobiales bacterium]
MSISLSPPPDAAPPQGTAFERLRTVKLGTVRQSFSPTTYQRSVPRALLWLAFDLVVYAALLVATLRVDFLPLKLLLGVLTGVAVASLFVWAHDAAHGALFKSAGVAEVLGTAAMLPSLNMYRLWCYGHNRVHHGFTSFSPVDWIWKPLTPAQYRAASPGARLVYRIERSILGCPLHYILRVWWPGMVRFRPEADVRKRHHFTAAKAVTALFAAQALLVAWLVGGGISGVVSAVLVPWLVFNFFIAFYIYLHHTHPKLPFFVDRQQWSATIGQVACSTVIIMPKVLSALSHHILVHAPHHIDMRIPFYRLPNAWKELAVRYGDDVVSYRFKLSTVRSIFRTCQLFDFDTKVWSRFADHR